MLNKKASLTILSILATLTLSTSSYASSYVMCHFNSFSTTHSPNTYPVTASHEVYIANGSNKTQSYHVEYRTFINKNLIKIESYTVTIKAKGSFTDNKTTVTNQKFTSKTNLSASCETLIAGSESNDIKGGGSIIVT